MNTTQTDKHSFIHRYKTVFIVIYIIFLLLLVEIVSRLFWTIRKDIPFFKPEEIVYLFYPPLRDVKQKQISKDDDYFDVLFLGGSVLADKAIEQILKEKYAYRTKKEMRIYNLSALGHSTLDSLHKYRFLSDKHFDLVVFYHGINDTRANNCSPSFFKKDYTHYSWYSRVNSFFDKYSIISFISFPYTYSYLMVRLKEVYGDQEYIPRHWPIVDWRKYGNDIKTKVSFRENLTKILDISKSRNEDVLLMTFTYYVPDGYTAGRFNRKTLDYTLYYVMIECWGIPDYVVKGIAAHNAIIEDVAQEYKNVHFVDQNKLIPKSGQYFNDICHFTYEGSNKFVSNILDSVIEINLHD